MKNVLKFIAIVAIACASLTSVEAAKKEKKELVTKEYVTDLHCEECAKKIMNTLPYQRGVKSVAVDVPTKVVKVTFDPAKSTEGDMIESLANVGIKVDSKAKACSASCCQH